MDDSTHVDGSSMGPEGTSADQTEPGSSSPQKFLTTRQAAFIGVGAMVGAGIFALLGAAGEVAGAAVWLSFLLAGVVAGLQGYSFAKLGSRYPTAGGMLEYVAKGFGDGHFTGITSWLTYSANIIVTAMVAVSFGSYASAMFAGENAVWAKLFAALIIIVMTVVNILGSKLVANAQTVIVYIVLGILTFFAVVTLATMTPVEPGAVGVSAGARHYLKRGADLLRLPRLRYHHLHGKGPRQAVAPAAQSDVSRAGDRHGHLRRHRAGRVRHAHGGAGDLLGRYRSGRGRRAHARQGGLLAYERHGVVRDCRGYQCGDVSGRGLIRPAGGNGAVSRADGATAWWQGIGRAAD